MKTKIIAEDKDHLLELIQHETIAHGFRCDLNHIDVSQVRSMSFLFMNSKFNGDISKWDVSNVGNMRSMFQHSEFNGDISNWDVTSVMCMDMMFKESSFSKDISDWKAYELVSFTNKFYGSKISKPYWSNYKDLDERRKAIDFYHLKKRISNDFQELSAELNVGTNDKHNKLKL